MKLRNFIWSAGALLLGLSTVPTNGVVAATISEDGRQATSTATVSLIQDPAANLKLIQVPDFIFAPQKVSTENQTYPVDQINGALTVENPGYSGGWTVKIHASDFTEKGSMSQHLVGAHLLLSRGHVHTDSVSAPPSGHALTVNKQDALILQAKPNEGLGSFTLVHQNTEVALYVPAGNQTGDYTATLTWTLESTP